MGWLACIILITGVIVLTVLICALLLGGVGALLGIVEGQLVARIFTLTWRLWLGWNAYVVILCVIGYINHCRYASVHHGFHRG